MPYVRYTTDLEEIKPDEAEVFARIAETFQGVGEKVRDNEGRASRVSHAKSTGLLKGELEILSGLPSELTQGLASTSRNYPVLARLAQGPGEHLDDKVSTHRGFALKVLGVTGPRIPETVETASQDWLFEAEETGFLNRNAGEFLLNLKAGVSHAPDVSEGIKKVVRDVSAATQTALKAVGLPSRSLGFFGHPPRHPLAETYFSQAPIRWGDHIGKLGLYPTQETLDSLIETKLDLGADPDVFRNAMIEHFEQAGAVFELRVQLATDIDAMPIEDASARWDEDDSPYRTVGLLRFAPQSAWNAAKSQAWDERMGFNPANSLEAHRPLGQVMRARLFVYKRLQDWRRATNAVRKIEPLTPADVAD
jgi:hypothetical protein